MGRADSYPAGLMSTRETVHPAAKRSGEVCLHICLHNGGISGIELRPYRGPAYCASGSRRDNHRIR